MFDFVPRLGGGGDRSSKPSSSTSSQSSSTLPVYSPLSATTFDQHILSSPASPTSSDHLPLDPLLPAQRHAAATTSPVLLQRPSLSRFLADFTLGFADGLTVPFALTAGLSSLGQTDTVIYAGMAEICAGSISMGIGGYLSAKGEEAQQERPTTTIVNLCTAADEEDDGESSVGLDEKGSLRRTTRMIIEEYLAPLNLPPELLDLVRNHVQDRDDVADALARQQLLRGEESDYDEDGVDVDAVSSPIMSGLSVALGYLIGGSLPLFPYFIVSHVGDGLMWSFIVCIIALFTFGFTKDLMLHLRKAKDVWVKEKDLGRRRWGWTDIRRSSWEGLQMVLLGSMAALAAVLCVRLFDSMGHDTPQP